MIKITTLFLFFIMLAIVSCNSTNESLEKNDIDFNNSNEETHKLGDSIDPTSFETKATISRNDDLKFFVSAISAIEKHPLYSPEWSRLVIRFYPFELDGDDIKNITLDKLELIRKKRYIYTEYNTELVNSTIYNNYAELYLNIDRQFKVGQIDISVPGYSCTVAYTQKDIDDFLQEFKLDVDTVNLSSKGSAVCPRNFKNISFSWDIELNGLVFDLR